jgi:hypothetical protein
LSRRRFLPTLLALALAASITGVADVAAADDAACIAASEQALALRKQGQLRKALEQLAVCADARCPDEVRAECAKRIDAVGSATPTVVFAVKDGAGNDLSAVRVTMDGGVVLEALDGRPLAVDPGEHTFRFETTGQPPVEKKLVIREGEKDRHEGIVLGPPPPVAPPAPPPPSPTPSTWSTQKTLALVGGGVGLVGIGVGVVFGLYAVSSQNREKSDCPSAGCPGLAQGTEDYNTAKKDALGSTIAFAAGAVFVAGGAVLWLTAPPARGASPSSGLGWRLAPAIMGTGAGVSVGGDL